MRSGWPGNHHQSAAHLWRPLRGIYSVDSFAMRERNSWNGKRKSFRRSINRSSSLCPTTFCRVAHNLQLNRSLKAICIDNHIDWNDSIRWDRIQRNRFPHSAQRANDLQLASRKFIWLHAIWHSTLCVDIHLYDPAAPAHTRWSPARPLYCVRTSHFPIPFDPICVCNCDVYCITCPLCAFTSHLTVMEYVQRRWRATIGMCAVCASALRIVPRTSYL